MTNNQIPAYLLNNQLPAAPDLTDHLGAGSPPYLSIAGNRFTLVDASGAEEPVETYDPKTGPYIDCMVIDGLERMSKIYYDKPYDPNAQQYEPPACFSDNGIGPSRNASRPQSPTCASCPHSAWGSKVSAVSGKGVKACSDYQKLAIMRAGDEVVFLMRVPPNSLSNLRNYLNKFKGQQISYRDVVTRISFEPSGIGTLRFDAVSYAVEGEILRRNKLLLAKATDTLVGRTDVAREALPAPAAPSQIAAQAAVPAPAAAPFVPAPAPAIAAPAAPVNPVSAPEQPQRQRRRRNTAAQPAAPVQAAPVAPFRPEQGNGAQPVFGMQVAAAGVPNEVEQTLNSLFPPPQ